MPSQNLSPRPVLRNGVKDGRRGFKKFLAKKFVESAGIFFSVLLVFTAIVFAFTTWSPGGPPQAAPGEGNVELEEALWTKNGPAKIFYNGGNVGIGTTSPIKKLDVAGDIKASGTICDKNGCIGGGGGTSSVVRVDNTKYFSCSLSQQNVEVSCPTGTVLIDCGVQNTDSQRRITDTAEIGSVPPAGQAGSWWVDRGTDADPNANHCQFRMLTNYTPFCNRNWTVSAYCLKIE